MPAQDLNKIQSSALPTLEFKGGAGNVGSIITSIIPYLFFIAGALLLINLIIGGLQMMLSRGDPKAMQSAQSKITASIIGFVIVLASYWLVQLVGNIFKIEAIKSIF